MSFKPRTDVIIVLVLVIVFFTLQTSLAQTVIEVPQDSINNKHSIDLIKEPSFGSINHWSKKIESATANIVNASSIQNKKTPYDPPFQKVVESKVVQIVFDETGPASCY